MVAAFAQSGGAAALKTHKCLNSVMGETFEVCTLYMAPALYGRTTLQIAAGCLVHACYRKDDASIAVSRALAKLFSAELLEVRSAVRPLRKSLKTC